MGRKKLIGIVIVIGIFSAGFGVSAFAGNVLIFNPTGCDYNVSVNGSTETLLQGIRVGSYVPSPTTFPRSKTPQPKGEIGSTNQISVTLGSGENSKTAHFGLDIPSYLALKHNIQLYIFFCASINDAHYFALLEGEVLAPGGVGKLTLQVQ